MSFRPPSYDPYSPSYDPSAASPCNPFPTSSPFAIFAFSPPRSALAFDMAPDPEFEPTPQPTPRPAQLARTTAAALAHIPPPHSAPAMRRTKPCRFYLTPAGCKTGRWCNFKHPVGANAGPEGDANSGSPAALRAAVARSRGDPNDPAVWENIPDVRDVDPDWGKKSDDEVHPKFRTQPCRNYLLGLCRYADKCQFIHAPGLFAPGAAEVPTSLPVSAASVPVSVWGSHPGIGSPESASGEKHGQMSLYYRTKPCKFFDTDGTCPHGPDCKFIHDPKKATPISVSPPSWADDDRELDLGDTPCFGGPVEDRMNVDSPAMHDVTNRADRSRDSRRVRDSSADKEREREREGGIYKPLWRVLGGGVKMGKATDVQMRMGEVDDDAVLEYQPRDTSPLPVRVTNAHTIQPVPTPPLDFTYTPFDPAQYPPHSLLRPPSPTGAPLEITMGRLESHITSVAGGRKKRVITGADLMRGLNNDREKEKPRLTIAVPTPVSFARAAKQQHIVTHTPAGDDVLDWGEEENDDAQDEHMEDAVPRRVRSTPPTPRSSASYLDVPILAKLSAESP